MVVSDRRYPFGSRVTRIRMNNFSLMVSTAKERLLQAQGTIVFLIASDGVTRGPIVGKIAWSPVLSSKGRLEMHEKLVDGINYIGDHGGSLFDALERTFCEFRGRGFLAGAINLAGDQQGFAYQRPPTQSAPDERPASTDEPLPPNPANKMPAKPWSRRAKLAFSLIFAVIVRTLYQEYFNPLPAQIVAQSQSVPVTQDTNPFDSLDKQPKPAAAGFDWSTARLISRPAVAVASTTTENTTRYVDATPAMDQDNASNGKGKAPHARRSKKPVCHYSGVMSDAEIDDCQ